MAYQAIVMWCHIFVMWWPIMLLLCDSMSCVGISCYWHVSACPVSGCHVIDTLLTRVSMSCYWHVSACHVIDMCRHVMLMSCISRLCYWHVSAYHVIVMCQHVMLLTRVSILCYWHVMASVWHVVLYLLPVLHFNTVKYQNREWAEKVQHQVQLTGPKSTAHSRPVEV